MPGSLPPFDRAVALACSMRTLRGRWLAVQCGCGASSTLPIKLMLVERPDLARATLADVLVNLRCHQCRGRPASVALVETSYGGLDEGGGWRCMGVVGRLIAAGRSPVDPGNRREYVRQQMRPVYSLVTKRRWRLLPQLAGECRRGWACFNAPSLRSSSFFKNPG